MLLSSAWHACNPCGYKTWCGTVSRLLFNRFWHKDRFLINKVQDCFLDLTLFYHISWFWVAAQSTTWPCAERNGNNFETRYIGDGRCFSDADFFFLNTDDNFLFRTRITRITRFFLNAIFSEHGTHGTHGKAAHCRRYGALAVPCVRKWSAWGKLSRDVRPRRPPWLRLAF